ncbi:hypothetical protein L3X38_015929 [Prunus dulcis]|uniref:Uncharacterized protein n=1 Tax=Prunus dulcis TaxID=3755 RepID=A0AAD4W6V9_PRUDU|nr:hypothetical protein L3X38_015929 [Prunus dulcis]
MDKLEISKRFTEPRQEGNKRRILERLDSDVQKLTNLQITVEDLKWKVDITEKSKKGKGIEFENVKGQLEEADEAITKLFDVNQKLMKNVEDGPLFSDGASERINKDHGAENKSSSEGLYSYGGNRTSQKRKKAPFCACIQPPTKGD